MSMTAALSCTMGAHPRMRSLFDADVPDGFRHHDDFITTEEEAALLGEIARVEFSTFEMRGVAARRRVAFFGSAYDAGSAAAAPIPGFLLPLRSRFGGWAEVEPAAFEMGLIMEYPAGAPIGWHRDAPQYGIVAGLSLLSACRMKFRPYVSPKLQASQAGGRRTATHEIILQPRSAYLMTAESRTSFEHHIPAVAELRYSITFRTLRSPRRVPRRA
jgi:alkylated DNA repair dioxygenase AlkB